MVIVAFITLPRGKAIQELADANELKAYVKCGRPKCRDSKISKSFDSFIRSVSRLRDSYVLNPANVWASSELGIGTFRPLRAVLPLHWLEVVSCRLSDVSSGHVSPTLFLLWFL